MTLKLLQAPSGIDKKLNKTYNKTCRESTGFLFEKRWVMKKKITFYSEFAYIIAILILSFSVAMVSAADLGVSMIVAPAYILSQKVSFLTFGQSEYVIQAMLFILFCILMKKVKLIYFASFLNCVVYGAALDMWRAVVPVFNPEITAPGSMSMPIRIAFFVVGSLITAFSIALFFRVYLYPQVYDFFVKGITEHFKINQTKFKTGFDMSCLAVSVIMTLVFFKGFVGIGFGTIILAVVNGSLIGACGKILDKVFVIKPLSPKLAKKCEI